MRAVRGRIGDKLESIVWRAKVSDAVGDDQRIWLRIDDWLVVRLVVRWWERIFVYLER